MPPSPESPHVPTEREIFAAAAVLPVEERAAYLDVICEARPELRARVEAWLGEHESNEFMETVVDGNRVKSEQAGERIGNYKLLQQIGEGGFGTVWMAEQMEPVSRRVALKIIKLGMDTREVIARFEAERQALAMMDHPNIAKVHDAGATQSGRPYFVMELVKGMPITKYCDEAGLGTRERLALFGDVCSAINHAHQKGIIHRDIKPSNVMVTQHGDKPVVKVIDFGIAKATQGKLTDKTLFTRFEQFIGTPVYMSPEQASTSGLDIDTRSDIYALGVLLYELLVGKPPFDAKSLASAGYEEMRRIIREVEPPKPSTRLKEEQTAAAQTGSAKSALRIPHSAIEPDLDWIVMKAIEKDRSRRYETANGLAADIVRFLADEPVSATPPGAGYRFRKFARRNRVALRVAAGIAALLMAATAVSTWQAVRATRAEKLARDEAVRATGEAVRATEAEKKTADTLVQVEAERDAKELARKEAEDISKFLGEVFQSPDPARDGRTITVAETLDTAAKKLDTDLAAQPAQRAKLQATLGQTYGALGLYREAIPLMEKARDYWLATFGGEDLTTLAQMDLLATAYRRAGRLEEALRLGEETLPLIRRLCGPEHPNTLSAMGNLAISYEDAGLRVEALKLNEELLPLRRKVNGPDDPDTLSAMTNLAVSLFGESRREDALRLREEVMKLCRRVSGPEHPRTITAMRNLALSLSETGRPDEGLKLTEETLLLSRKVFGPEHGNTIGTMHNLAYAYFKTGRREEALTLQEEVLALGRKVHGPEHPDTLKAMTNLANFYPDPGRGEDELKLLEELLPLSRKVNGPEHPDTLGVMTNLAISLGQAGRLDEAIELQKQSLTIKRRVLPPEDLHRMVALGSMADLYGRAGRKDEALKLREEVLPLRRKVLGPEHRDTLYAMTALATSYAAAGREEEALKMREEVLTLSRKVNGPEHSDTLGAMTNLASSYGAAGRLPEAIELQEQSLAIKRRVLPPNHLYLAIALGNMADLYEMDGRGAEALKVRGEVEALRRASFPAIHATLVAPDAEWKWLHPNDGKDPAGNTPGFHTAFFLPDFDDSAWKTGHDSDDLAGGFGYGKTFAGVDIGMPENEAHRHTAYFRHTFATDKEHANLELRCQRDDGIIVYLDGKEVLRDNMEAGADAYLLHSAETVGSENDGVAQRFPIPGTLAAGPHTLAISVHNTAKPSSGLRLGGVTLVEVKTSETGK